MSVPMLRRLRLPPAHGSPARAREAVAELLVEAELTALSAEALLLTSELVTNAVIHAGTEIEIELHAQAGGLRVSVTDFGPASAAPVIADVVAATPAHRSAGADPGQRDGGRGLHLVAGLATRWGTNHDGHGRQVWFQLDPRPAGTDPPAGAATGTGPSAGGALPPELDEALAQLSVAVGTPTLGGLVRRLARALAAASVTVDVDRADGAGRVILARHTSGLPAAADGRSVRVPLALSRPWTGEVTATGARGAHAPVLTALTAGQVAVLIENQRLYDAHDDARGWLLFLAHAGELLARSLNVDLIVALLPRLLVPRLGEWCAVHLVDADGDLALAALTHADEEAIAGLTAQLDAGGSALVAALGRADGVTPLGPPTNGMTVALAVRDERLGVLTVGRPPGRPHQPDDLAIVEDLGRRAATAIDNARIHDTSARIATALQQSLLPPKLPAIEGLEVAGEYVAAGDGLDVGGDFYDLVPLPSQGWMLVVGDVSGKGADAAAVTGLVRDVLHTLAREHHEPEHTLHRLNASLVERGSGHFCTLVLAFLSAPDAAGTVEVHLHLAGHDQPVLVRPESGASLVGRCGTALGLMEEIVSPRTVVRLRRGDALVFYTDGITERRRGTELFGHRRLTAELAALAGSPASVLAAQLRAAVLSFSAVPPRDDIAIVALRAR